MINRLQEFRERGKENGFSPITEDDFLTQDNIEKDRALVQSFMPMTKKAIVKIQEMHTNNQLILQLKHKQVHETRGDRAKEASDELSEKVRANQSNQKYIKETLDKMKLEVADARNNFPDEPECRVLIGIYSALMIRFRETLREFQESQLEYKNSTQDKIRRQIAIVKPDADESEINDLVNDPDATARLLNEQITGTAHMKIRNAVDDIDRKYQDILKLEKGVEEVYQLFLDLGTLIQAQGEMLDSILTNMQEAKNYVKQANVHFEKAQQIHKKSRTKMCIVLICLLVIIVVLIVVVLGVSLSV